MRNPLTTALLGLVVLASLPATLHGQGEVRVIADSVYRLLDVVDAITCSNPDSDRVLSELEGLDEPARRERLDAYARTNKLNSEIASEIERFLSTDTRKIYFRRFRNVTPDHFRDAFVALPYERISAPGDIAAPLHQLVGETEEVRALVNGLVSTIDVERCRRAAEEWLPDSDYTLPPLHLIYDNNAGSFTAEGAAFFNLFSGESVSDLQSSGGEAVIAHELHHVFARPHLMRIRRGGDRWEHDRMAMLVRNMVSEGAAMHCNPPAGFKKAVFEEEETIAALVGELNRMFLALEAGAVQETEFWDWHRASYHQTAAELLETYAKRRFGAREGMEKARSLMPMRPDLTHALGWWMVSRVSKSGTDPEAVKDLIQNPYLLFSRYNDVLFDADSSLKVDARVVAAIKGE